MMDLDFLLNALLPAVLITLMLTCCVCLVRNGPDRAPRAVLRPESEEDRKGRRARMEAMLIIETVKERGKRRMAPMHVSHNSKENSAVLYDTCLQSEAEEAGAGEETREVEMVELSETEEDGATVSDGEALKVSSAPSSEPERSATTSSDQESTSNIRNNDSPVHDSESPSCIQSSNFDDDCDLPMAGSPPKDNILTRSLSKLSSSLSDPYSSCDICLTDYEVSDQVCFSPNPKCHHAFHKDCLLDWLLRNPNCPVCRREYLPNDENESDLCKENAQVGQEDEEEGLPV